MDSSPECKFTTFAGLSQLSFQELLRSENTNEVPGLVALRQAQGDTRLTLRHPDPDNYQDEGNF
jgi:hypothetical protein